MDTRTMNRRSLACGVVGLITAVGLALGCSDSQGPADTGKTPPRSPFLVSSPVQSPWSASAGVARSASGAEMVVFVSLSPGTLAQGRVATIKNPRLGGTLTTAFLDGGFDPVPVPAAVGDTLTVEVQNNGSAGNTSYTCVVRESDPPVVVRTSPPPHKRDVPLNASIIVVFSTPIDEASLTGASVELRHGSTVVDGRLEFADDNHIAVVLIPNGALAPLTDYEVVVTGGIHDQSGDALQGPVTTQFTTGASSFPTALLRVRKAPLPNGDGQIGAAGTPLPLPLRVIVDSAQIPRAGVEVTWSAAAGTIEPLTSLTDSAGIAVASWTLDMIAGVATATATIAENPGLPANFSATARAGTVTRICCGVIPLAPMMMDGTYYPSRGVFPTDQFSNVVKGERLTWQVVSGPISVVVINVTPDQYGVSYMRLSPTGFEGVGVVRAALASAPASVYLDLSVSVRANGAVAYIEYVPHPTASFQTWAHSGHNGSVDPAVDTIAAGQTMVWALQDYDYDIHRITTSGGSLSLSTGDWAYGQMQDSVTLSTPGTYQYTDAYHATFKGTVVVK